jgi:inner membrane protein YidH
VSDNAPEDESDEPESGLASERTDLAWNRSGLALLACGAAVLRGFPPADFSARHAVGAVILVLGAFTWAMGAYEARRRSRPGLARRVATCRDLLPVMVGTAAVGLAAFVLAAFYPG